MPLSKVLREEFATADRSNAYQLFSGMLESEDYVLSVVLSGDLTKYRALENDPEVASSLQARKLAVVKRDWKVAPGGKGKAEQAIADLVKENLDSLNFDQLTLDAQDATLMGYWVGEAVYNQDGKSIYIEDVRTRAQDRFTFILPEGAPNLEKRGYTDGYEIRLCDRNFIKGDPVPAKKFVVHTFGSKTHNPFGLGLGSKLYWPVTIKKDATKLWLFYLDKFASPTPIGTYDPQVGNSKVLEQFLGAIATGSYAALPTGYDVKLLEAQRSGSIDAYEGIINRFCNTEIGKVILGRMNAGANQGLSGQPAENDEAIRQDIVKADADLLSSRLNRTLVKWLTDLNAPEGTKPPTVYRVFEETEDLKARSDRDKVLFDMGFRLSTKAQSEIYGADYVDTSATAGKDEKAPPLVTSLGVGGTQALIGMLQQAAGGSIPRENAIAAIVAIFGVDDEVAAAMVPEQPEGAGEPDLSSLIGGGEGEAPPAEAATEEPAPTEPAAAPGIEAAANLSEPQQELVEAIALLAQLDEAQDFRELDAAIVELAEEIMSAIDFNEARSLNYLYGAIGRRLIELAQQKKARSAEYQENDLIVTFAEDGVIEFVAKGGTKKVRNCNPAKSLSCGGSCQPLKTKSGKDTVCKNDLSAEGKAKAKKVKAALGGSSADEVETKKASAREQGSAEVSDRSATKPTKESSEDIFPPDDAFEKAFNDPDAVEKFAEESFNNDGSEGGIYKVKIGDKDFFVKRPENPLSAQSEAANYEIAKILGVEDDLLPTKVVMINGKPHSVSPFVQLENFTETGKEVDDFESIKSDAMTREEALRMLTFDYITANTDRHIGNLVKVNGKMKLVDNEFSLKETKMSTLPLTTKPVARWLDFDEENRSNKKRPIDKDVAEKAIQSLNEVVSILESRGLPTEVYKKRVELLSDVMNSGDPSFKKLISSMKSAKKSK